MFRMKYVTLGEIRTTFGLKGEVTVFSLTDFPKLRFKKGNELFLYNQKTGDRKEVTVKSYRDSGDYYYLAFNEINDVEEAKLLRGYSVEMEEDKAIIPEGYFRYSDIIGFDVIDAENNKILGKVKEILTYLPQTSIKVKREEGNDFTIPLVPAFIKEYDFEHRRVLINVWEGLL